MKRQARRRPSFIAVAVGAIGAVTLSSATHAEDAARRHAEAGESLSRFHLSSASSGVQTESFHGHRPGYGGIHAPQRTITPPGGWYRYGFPAERYRWGWFGAGRYYPHVVWHRGYYGDCCRWAYRHGY